MNCSYVSIRARHCWRANPSHFPSTVPMMWFQSAPAIAGGRISMQPDTRAASPGFNPRPPLLAGESGHASW